MNLVLTMLAAYAFYVVGWIRPYEGGTLLEGAAWLFIGLWLAKLLLWLPRALIKMVTLPVFIFFTEKIWYLIDGIFTYFALLLIAYWSKVFIVPHLMLQNIEKIVVMSLVFSIISYLCRPKSKPSSSSNRTSQM